jgi:hypothetical protein
VRKPQVIPDEDHEVVYERVAAVDVAKASGVACMRLPDPARPGRYANQIWDNVPATRAGITELGRELIRHQVQKVTLESTSDYWRIWYYVLESTGLAVQLVSASQAIPWPASNRPPCRSSGWAHMAEVRSRAGGMLGAVHAQVRGAQRRAEVAAVQHRAPGCLVPGEVCARRARAGH